MSKVPKNLPHEIFMRMEDRGQDAEKWENVLDACITGLDIMDEQFYEEDEIAPFTRMFKRWKARAERELASQVAKAVKHE